MSVSAASTGEGFLLIHNKIRTRNNQGCTPSGQEPLCGPSIPSADLGGRYEVPLWETFGKAGFTFCPLGVRVSPKASEAPTPPLWLFVAYYCFRPCDSFK